MKPNNCRLRCEEDKEYILESSLQRYGLRYLGTEDDRLPCPQLSPQTASGERILTESSVSTRSYQPFPLAAKIKCFIVFFMRTHGRTPFQVPELVGLLLGNWFVSQTPWSIQPIMFPPFHWKSKSSESQIWFVTTSNKYTKTSGQAFLCNTDFFYFSFYLMGSLF